jgi:hypothetical protein
VVLIDRMTASAAEVLGGALARAGSLLVGEPSYGKTTIQEVFPLADGGAAALTVARYETGEDAGSHFERLIPDLAVGPPGPTAPRGAAGARPGGPGGAAPPPADPVLARALEVVLGHGSAPGRPTAPARGSARSMLR